MDRATTINDGSLVVRGRDPFEMGASAVRASGPRATLAIKALARWGRAHPRDLERLGAVGPAGRRTLARLGSSGRAELEGASRAICLDAGDLFAARTLMGSIAQPACTNFGAVGPATEDGGTMLSWNFDVTPLFKPLFGSFPLFVRELEGSIPYVAFGIPALFGIGIMNAEGLSSVVNAVGIVDDGEGLSPFELNNIAMESCSTVAGAARVFADGPRRATKAMTVGLLMNWNTIWGDRDGNLSLFEYSHNHFNKHDVGEPGWVASANHHQFLDRSLTGSFDPESQELIAGSYSRLGRMQSLLGEHQGRIGPEVVKSIISDHIPDYSILKDFGIKREWWEQKVDDSTICAHAWNVREKLGKGQFGDAFMELGFSTTLFSMQIQPQKMTCWFTKGHPCSNETTPTYWGRLLGSSAERWPGAVEPRDLFKEKRQTTRRSIFHRDAPPLESALGSVWMWGVRTVEKPNFK